MTFKLIFFLFLSGSLNFIIINADWKLWKWIYGIKLSNFNALFKAIQNIWNAIFINIVCNLVESIIRQVLIVFNAKKNATKY